MTRRRLYGKLARRDAMITKRRHLLPACAGLAVRRATQCVLLLSVAGLVTMSKASVQAYPSSTIRIVVPSGATTPPDIISRIVANELSASESWRVAVENPLGGSLTAGTADGPKPKADGHSILAVSMPPTAMPGIRPHVYLRPAHD